MHVDEIDTPAVIIDLDKMEENMRDLAAYCRRHNLHLRPHTKTHKTPELAHLQIEYGARGITVAKVSEARMMHAAGIRDILVAYPIISDVKAEELARLATSASITVSLDSVEAARVLSRQAVRHSVSIGVLTEVDVGMRRCGVGTSAAALALSRSIHEMPGIDFQGIMFFPGHMMARVARQRELLADVNPLLDDIYAVFAREGIAIRQVSGGSTPTAYLSAEFHGVTEIRSGMYLFNDRNMVGAEVTSLERCALCVLVTVVSNAVPGKVIVDGGSKTFSSDRFLSGHGRGYGTILEDPAAELEAMSEEHGHLDIRTSGRTYHLGERLHIVPNHVCTTINMHENMYGIRGHEVETVWKVAGHGKLQ